MGCHHHHHHHYHCGHGKRYCPYCGAYLGPRYYPPPHYYYPPWYYKPWPTYPAPYIGDPICSPGMTAAAQAKSALG